MTHLQQSSDDTLFVRSLDELKKLVRKIEFNKTEHELLVELVDKAMKAGEGERERLKHISKKSHELFKTLKDMDLFYQIKSDAKSIDALKRIPIGAVDGSFQVVGGTGGRWYGIFGISQIMAEKGFTLEPVIKVDGDIEPLEAVDEGAARHKAEIVMMLGEMKGFRKVAYELGSSKKDCYLLIDGPVIDPPLYMNEEYIESRVDALRFCIERDVNVVGFVKRVMGSNYLAFLKNELGKEQVAEFTNDLDLLSTVMFDAVKEASCPVYTHPLSFDEINGKESNLTLIYECYRDKGLTVYYSYYKPSLRGRVFRIEYASLKEISEQKASEKFSEILSVINTIWTLPGMEEPLPIAIAHNKCNVRRGAAETLYYEIMARALSKGDLHLWLESIT